LRAGGQTAAGRGGVEWSGGEGGGTWACALVVGGDRTLMDGFPGAAWGRGG